MIRERVSVECNTDIPVCDGFSRPGPQARMPVSHIPPGY